MGTEINVTVGPQSLKDRNRQETDANRFRKVEQDAQQRTQDAATDARRQQLAQQGLTADGAAQYGNPSRLEFLRQKPAAFRFGGDLLLLLHMDGVDSDSPFIDSSRRRLRVTANGNAQISTAQSKFGGASGLFDGDGDWLSVSGAILALGAGDFTIEAWVRVPLAAARQGNMGIWVYPDLGNDTGLYVTAFTNNKGSFCELKWIDGQEGGFIFSYDTFGFDEWVHIAAVRDSGIIYLYLNGAQQVQTTAYQPPIDSPNVLIGRSNFEGVPSSFMYGNIDELRVSAVAVYTESFTPPSQPFR